MEGKTKKITKKAVLYLVLIILALIWVVPMFTLVATADGEISSTFETHHAVGMTTADGAELLMHIGIDTVKLGGKHFTYLVNEGDKVKKGQPLIRFELEAIKAEGYPVTTPLIVCNTDDYAAVAAKASGTVKQGDALLELKR